MVSIAPWLACQAMLTNVSSNFDIAHMQANASSSGLLGFVQVVKYILLHFPSGTIIGSEQPVCNSKIGNIKIEVKHPTIAVRGSILASGSSFIWSLFIQLHIKTPMRFFCNAVVLFVPFGLMARIIGQIFGYFGWGSGAILSPGGLRNIRSST